MKQTQDWNRDALLQLPLFAPLHPLISCLNSSSIPTLHDLNSLLASREITVRSGSPLRFVAQQAGRLAFEAQYEPRCYLMGEVQTRDNDLHDVFNALVWLTFPKSKAAINARHYAALLEKTDGHSGGRGPVRDTNTLFDESGVIVAYADERLAGLLHNFAWLELFWHQRERLQAAMGFYLFGHGLYEKAVQPYVGMTGHGLLLAVERNFFDMPIAEQLAHLDVKLAEYLADPEHCRSTRELSPVPLLGVPGWAADNECVSYYENTDYFRPGRAPARAETGWLSDTRSTTHHG